MRPAVTVTSLTEGRHIVKGKSIVGTSLFCSLLFLSVTAAQATPYFTIGSQAEWQNALTSGRITPVLGSTFASMVGGESQWPSEYKNATFYTPELQAVADASGSPALYMTWGGGGGGGGGYMAAAWDYTYPIDPNLNNARIDFSILPPVLSTMFSLNLIDGNGNYREWIWHAGGAAGDPVVGQWNSLWIDPASGASNFNPVALFTHDVPGTTFDLGSVQILRFDENISVLNVPFPAGPLGNVPAGWVWNAWDHVGVVPEPETYAMLLAGLGLLGFMARRRKQKESA